MIRGPSRRSTRRISRWFRLSSCNNNGSYDDARDIFQEAMIALYEKAQSDSFVLTSQIKTYVYSICRRLWLKRLQQMGRYAGQVENMEETVAVEEDMEIHEKRNAEFAIMDRAMNSLGEPCKSLLEGYYLKKDGDAGTGCGVWLHQRRQCQEPEIQMFNAAEEIILLAIQYRRLIPWTTFYS
jgi:RNA polymerase sigma factor (sigma-70 family)